MKRQLIAMQDLDLQDKRVLIREDFNVPLANGNIASATRIESALPNIKLALEKGARLILMSHLGRPTEGSFDASLSLKPVADYLSQSIGEKVQLVSDWQQRDPLGSSRIVLLENVRFNVGELADDDALGKKYASLADVFVMNAFGTAHRAQASTHSVAKQAPIACAGELLIKELEALDKVLKNPKRPMLAIVGGSKVSGKLEVLQSLSKVVDQLIVGGGIANTFLAAAGYDVGKSLYEPGLLAIANQISRTTNIPLPEDVVTAKKLSAKAQPTLQKVDALASDDMIFDIGPKTQAKIKELLQQAQTIVWNGPVGVFEQESFAQGTKTLANAIAQSAAFSIAGGGDTLAAIDKYNIADKISYISTGGGAFLEYLQGSTLPAIKVLATRAEDNN